MKRLKLNTMNAPHTPGSVPPMNLSATNIIAAPANVFIASGMNALRKRERERERERERACKRVREKERE